MNLKACLNFARVKFKSFFQGYFIVFTCQIARQVKTERKTGKKCKEVLIEKFRQT